MTVLVKVAQCDNNKQAQSNMLFVSQAIYNQLVGNNSSNDDCIVSIKGYLFSIAVDNTITLNVIKLNSFQRLFLYVSFTDELKLETVNSTDLNLLVSAMFEVSCKTNKKLVFTNDELAERCKQSFANIPVNLGMKYHLKMNETNLIVEVKSIQAGKLNSDGELTLINNANSALLSTTSSLTFVKGSQNVNITNDENETNNLFKSDWSFEEMGVGGLDKEFSTLFRRAFASRIYPQKIVKQLGINHVKGILLYGPPGTGKTLMARQIGKMLNCVEPKIVNGPEIFDKMVGESEKKIRDLFKEAEQDEAENGDNAQLHLIIMDEIDSICKKRGSVNNGTGVNDQVVNQLLTKIDGVNALNDVLLIGMTNRRDLIDDALLRPGRLEVQLEIHLPDQHGRKQIFEIHTKIPRENERIDEDVNLEELAKLTTNYTGAEIAGVVRSAISFSMNEYIDMNESSNSFINSSLINNIKINRSHFMRALEEVKPEFGIEDDMINKYINYGCICYSDQFDSLMNNINYCIQTFINGSGVSNNNYLIYGKRGSGLTTCAITLATNNGFDFVKLITADKFIGMSEDNVCRELVSIFSNAYRSMKAAVIIDDLDLIIEYSRMGPRYSNKILQAVLTFMRTPTTPTHKLSIFITTTKKEELELLGLEEDCFNKLIELPLIRDVNEWMVIGEAMYISVDTISNEQLIQQLPIKKVIQVLDMVKNENAKITAKRINECVEMFC